MQGEAETICAEGTRWGLPFVFRFVAKGQIETNMEEMLKIVEESDKFLTFG